MVADIGGGNGSQITEILKKHTRIKGILFDLPHVIARAKERIQASGLLDRCKLVSGSFFDAVPEGGASLAGAIALLREGKIQADERVVAFNTGAGWLYRG